MAVYPSNCPVSVMATVWQPPLMYSGFCGMVGGRVSNYGSQIIESKSPGASDQKHEFYGHNN
jgi:hypothetical protein